MGFFSNCIPLQWRHRCGVFWSGLLNVARALGGIAAIIVVVCIATAGIVVCTYTVFDGPPPPAEFPPQPVRLPSEARRTEWLAGGWSICEFRGEKFLYHESNPANLIPLNHEH